MRAFLLALLPATLLSAPGPVHSRPAPSHTASDTLRLVVAPDGNEARYRVREQLAHHDLPNDAVGVTHAVTGTVVLDGQGRFVPGASRVTVDVRPLQSDRSFRDRYVQGRILETETFPSVEFAPAASAGFPAAIPAGGDFAFTVTGPLTVHGTTRPTTWQVSARTVPGGYTGTATTRFTFEDFGLNKPNVPIVLSVADTITLEYDFHLVPAPK
ncbi:MAG TPA: YceI family protein [Gemmatimonadales bacterium]|jgi:polyisoprenoid-binding protein YceI|nr:YceI family protein [Gemmatimonadales bacterium]